MKLERPSQSEHFQHINVLGRASRFGPVMRLTPPRRAPQNLDKPCGHRRNVFHGCEPLNVYLS